MKDGNLLKAIVKKYKNSYENLSVKFVEGEGYLIEYINGGLVWDIKKSLKDVVNDLEGGVK